jgi:hypothetical protein
MMICFEAGWCMRTDGTTVPTYQRVDAADAGVEHDHVFDQDVRCSFGANNGAKNERLVSRT